MSNRHNALRGPRRQLVFDLVETSRLLRGHMESVAVRHGTTRAQWALLARVRRREGVSQADLAAEMEIAPISLARLIDRTQAEGYVERRAHETDRRINRLFLTELGRTVVGSFDQQREEIAAFVLDGLDISAIETATAVLARVASQIRKSDRPALPANDWDETVMASCEISSRGAKSKAIRSKRTARR